MTAKDTGKAQPAKKKRKKPVKVEHVVISPQEAEVPKESPGNISQEIPADAPSIGDAFHADCAGPSEEPADEGTPFIVTELPVYAQTAARPGTAAPLAPDRKRRLWFSRNGHQKTTLCKAIVFVREPARSWYFTNIERQELEEKGITPVKNGRGGWIYPVVIGRDGSWTNWPRTTVPLMASAHALYKATHWPQHKSLATLATEKWQKATTYGIVAIIVLLVILSFLLLFFFVFLR